MKISFSTYGWENYSWQDFVKIARDCGFNGIDVHSIHEPRFKDSGLFDKANSSVIVRQLFDLSLSIPCISSSCDITDNNVKTNIKHIKTVLSIAENLSCPYVRVGATNNENSLANCKKNTITVLKEVISVAREKHICILLETIACFSDSAFLCQILEHFASDNLAALWDVQHTVRDGAETPETTIKNLGAYVRHVHMKDSCIENGVNKYCLVGEGTLPITETIRALYSINYDGFVALEWLPSWGIVQELELIALHFASVAKKWGDTRRQLSTRRLYENKSGTGYFPWQKEKLIEKTFSDVLDQIVQDFPDQYAFRYTSCNYTRTYKEFRDDVDQAARALMALGVKAGSHVALWCTNLPQWYITFWAVTKIGAVLVTMNTAYKINEAEYLLRQSDTHTLVMIDHFKDISYEQIIHELCPELDTHDPNGPTPLACKRLPFLRNVISVNFHSKGCLNWDDAMDLAEKTPVIALRQAAKQVSVHDVCNMQYTSGTTGFPKGVMLTHHNVVNNGKCIGDRMDLSTADRMMIHVPMFHCFGMVLAMTASMTHGATLSPLPYFSTKASLSCINEERITCFHGVPTMFIAMMEHPDFANTDFSYMRTGIMAGSPCPESKMRDVIEKMNMKEIVIVYGQTEASPGCTMSETDDPLEVRVTTVGHALPEVECRVVNPETGEDCPDNVSGEFLARGYNIMKGYYKMPEATHQAIDEHGWLHTGDLACRTPEGNYKITGRLKDMIIRGGENIYPKELEEFLYTHPKVKDIQVIGVPDEALGEEIAAVIIVKEGEELTEQEVKEFFLAHVARHKCPKYVQFVSEFPMNAAGKILKYKMREDIAKKINN